MNNQLVDLARKTTVGYRMGLKWRTLRQQAPTRRSLLQKVRSAAGRPGKPLAPWHNAVLQSRAEVDLAMSQAAALGLPIMSEPSKNWDSLAALDCILANTDRTGSILDAGSEMYSRILPWLFLYGYERLRGNNLVFDKRTNRGPVIYEPGDVTRTTYGDGEFDAITCLSVVEHGVDLTAYFREMSRILRPGGILLTSTDYWQTPVDTGGQRAYGVPVHIFTEAQVREAIETASRFGLQLTGPMNFESSEPVVRWLNLDYTFILFALRKTGATQT